MVWFEGFTFIGKKPIKKDIKKEMKKDVKKKEKDNFENLPDRLMEIESAVLSGINFDDIKNIPPEKIKAILKQGLSEDFLVRFYGISKAKWELWKRLHPEVAAILAEWKEMATDKVEQSLYENAIHGDVTAQKTWLTNMRPDVWADKKEVKISGVLQIQPKPYDIEERIKSLSGEDEELEELLG